MRTLLLLMVLSMPVQAERELIWITWDSGTRSGDCTPIKYQPIWEAFYEMKEVLGSKLMKVIIEPYSGEFGPTYVIESVDGIWAFTESMDVCELILIMLAGPEPPR